MVKIAVMETVGITVGIKEEAKFLVDQLPDNATWDDLMHEVYVRQSIEDGGWSDNQCRSGSGTIRTKPVKVE